MEENKREDFNEEESDLVVFVDENGKEYEFEIIDELTEDGVQYLAMLSTEEAQDNDDDEAPDSDELVVAKVIEENGEETLVLLEDEEEFDKISKLFTERLSEFFDFVDEDEDGEDHCCSEEGREGCSGCGN